MSILRACTTGMIAEWCVRGSACTFISLIMTSRIFADSDHSSITGLLRFQNSKGMEIDIYCDGS
jgi:hypothetical protein